MNFDLKILWPLLAVGVWILYRFWRAKQLKALLSELLNRDAQIVDVRSPVEFAAGAAQEAINIPLTELKSKVNTLSANRPVVVCCASGSRSTVAAALLKHHGFSEVYNAGAWTNLKP